MEIITVPLGQHLRRGSITLEEIAGKKSFKNISFYDGGFVDLEFDAAKEYIAILKDKYGRQVVGRSGLDRNTVLRLLGKYKIPYKKKHVQNNKGGKIKYRKVKDKINIITKIIGKGERRLSYICRAIGLQPTTIVHCGHYSSLLPADTIYDVTPFTERVLNYEGKIKTSLEDGLSLRKIAEKTGLSPQTIHNYKKYIKHIPKKPQIK